MTKSLIGFVHIKDEFEINLKRFRITDIGTRVIVAIDITNESNVSGPPYKQTELVFDEEDALAITKIHFKSKECCADEIKEIDNRKQKVQQQGEILSSGIDSFLARLSYFK